METRPYRSLTCFPASLAYKLRIIPVDQPPVNTGNPPAGYAFPDFRFLVGFGGFGLRAQIVASSSVYRSASDGDPAATSLAYQAYHFNYCADSYMRQVDA